MNHKQKIRLVAILGILVCVSLALGLTLYALKKNINLFYTPTELLQSSYSPNQTVRIGGYVKTHSVHYDPSGQSVNFIITDRSHEISVSFSGVLPSLFREGQGVVVTGELKQPGLFQAEQVLAKHDEKYMPRSLREKLKKQTQEVSHVS